MKDGYLTLFNLNIQVQYRSVNLNYKASFEVYTAALGAKLPKIRSIITSALENTKNI
jgi:hypothetical protein